MNTSEESEDSVFPEFESGDQGAVSDEEVDNNSCAQPEGIIEIARRWPKQTFFILGNEFCERFCYYGLRAVLTLYLMTILAYSCDAATALYHGFVCIAYISPILGSIIADGFIGKYWTIVSISCVYALGQSLLSLFATFPPESSVHPYLDFLVMVLVALGTGLIKPCISAFGADQFPKEEKKMISMFFSVFYVAINCGSLLASFIVPIFRVQPCFDEETCFSLAFGVPAAMMILAVVIFATGTPHYVKSLSDENIIVAVAHIIVEAIRKKTTSNEEQEHWLDHALDGHNCDIDERCCQTRKGRNTCAKKKLIEDVKSLFRVAVLFTPIPMFFALFEQQGSRWVVQATMMDGEVAPWLTIYPDQMHVVNPMMIIILVPLFQVVIYPALEKIGACPSLLQRIGLGGFLAAAAFIISGFVQLKVDSTLPEKLNSTHAIVSVINSYPNSSCDFIVEVDEYGAKRIEANTMTSNIYKLMGSREQNVTRSFRVGDKPLSKKTFTFRSDNPGCPSRFEIEQRVEGGKDYVIVLAPSGWSVLNNAFDKTHKAGGQYTLSLVHLVPCDKWLAGNTSNCNPNGTYKPSIAVCVKSINSDGNCEKLNRDFYYWLSNEITRITVHDYTTGKAVFSGALLQPKNIPKGVLEIQYLKYFHYGQQAAAAARVPISGLSFTHQNARGEYAITITDNIASNDTLTTNVYMMAAENMVSILWQLPAYVVITLAEIFLSISGPEFAYQEASKELKSVVQAMWLLTQAIGNVVVLIVAGAHFATPAVELFAFGVAMVVVMILFVFLATFYYTYRGDYNILHQNVPSESMSSASLSP